MDLEKEIELLWKISIIDNIENKDPKGKIKENLVKYLETKLKELEEEIEKEIEEVFEKINEYYYLSFIDDLNSASNNNNKLEKTKEIITEFNKKYNSNTNSLLKKRRKIKVHLNDLKIDS